MKAYILILATMVITSTAVAQQKRIKTDKVPQTVQDAFKVKFPNAIIQKWKKENDTYIAEYKQEKKKYETTFDSNGTWMNTATAIKWKEVPEIVKTAYGKSTYKKWEIDNVTQVNSSDGTTLYIVEADNGDEFRDADRSAVFKETHEIYISSKGEIIKTHKKC